MNDLYAYPAYLFGDLMTGAKRGVYKGEIKKKKN